MNEILTALYRASKPKEALASQDEFGGSNCLLGSDVEKFAELIIRECADIATINQYQPYTAGYYVKKHFGIE